MRIAIKTLKRIVIEVTKEEVDSKGFDKVWDEIREKYPKDAYDLYTTENDPKNDLIIFFELAPKEIV